MHRIAVKKHNYTVMYITYQLHVSAVSNWTIIRMDTIVRETILSNIM